MEWIDIWKEEPPRNEEILFMTGNEKIYRGIIFCNEKLRKCEFYSFETKKYFCCDVIEKLENRVTHWVPITMPEED